MTTKLAKYSKLDTGCYVDSARGIYSTDAIISFAESHGFVPEPCDCPECNKPNGIALAWSQHEFANELEDEATDYMNDKYWVKDCSWGRNENSDWGLWENDSEA